MALTSARLTRRPSSTVSSRMTSTSLMADLLARLDRDEVLGADDERLGHVPVHDVEDEGLALLAADDADQALEALVRHAAVLAGLELDGDVVADLELLQHAVGRQDAALARVLQQQVARLGAESLGADGHGEVLVPAEPWVGHRSG